MNIRWPLHRRTAFFLLLWTWIWAPLVAQGPTVAPRAPIIGEYRCQGEDAVKPYTITLVVSPHGDALHLEWIAEGKVVYKGLGIDRDGYLATLVLGADGRLATAIYKIEPHVLVGSWTDGTARFPETCKKNQGNL